MILSFWDRTPKTVTDYADASTPCRLKLLELLYGRKLL